MNEQIELNQTIEQKITTLNRLADDVKELYNQVTAKANQLLEGGVYEGESASETQNQFTEFKTNFEKYYNTIKSIPAAFAEAKSKTEATVAEQSQKARELNNVSAN